MKQIYYMLTKSEMEDLVFNCLDKFYNSITDEEKPIKWLTRKEVLKLLAISSPTLLSYTKKGYLTAYRIGRTLRYKDKDVIESLKQVRNNNYRKDGYKHGK